MFTGWHCDSCKVPSYLNDLILALNTMYKMLKVLWYILLLPKIQPHLQYKRKMPLKQPYSSFLIKEYIDPYVYY